MGAQQAEPAGADMRYLILAALGGIISLAVTAGCAVAVVVVR